jgi:hypothetical protein
MSRRKLMALVHPTYSPDGRCASASEETDSSHRIQKSQENLDHFGEIARATIRVHGAGCVIFAGT